MNPRQYTPADLLINRLEKGLLHLRGASPTAATSANNAASARLMRVNYAGEVAAQGLYQGQAMVARNAQTRSHLLAAAEEERQHLQWCGERLAELGDAPSKLTPLWHAGATAIGVVVGLAGDAKSLGFVAETERQVSEHLSDHIKRLPKSDVESRTVLANMKADEERHGADALAAGGAIPPAPVRGLMRVVAGVMKFAAARW